MSKVTNIMIAGVGGQGTILAGRILSVLAQNAGYEVKVSEVHGMSQRGGSVVTQVRYGEQVHAPIITPGEADVLLAFEKLEALRMLPLLREGGRLLVNAQELLPMPVLSGAAEYPENIEELLTAAADNITVLDAYALAEEAGSAKAVNTVLLGKLSQSMEFAEQDWLAALEACVKPKFLPLNQKAFALGRGA